MPQQPKPQQQAQQAQQLGGPAPLRAPYPGRSQRLAATAQSQAVQEQLPQRLGHGSVDPMQSDVYLLADQQRTVQEAAPPPPKQQQARIQGECHWEKGTGVLCRDSSAGQGT